MALRLPPPFGHGRCLTGPRPPRTGNRQFFLDIRRRFGYLFSTQTSLASPVKAYRTGQPSPLSTALRRRALRGAVVNGPGTAVQNRRLGATGHVFNAFFLPSGNKIVSFFYFMNKIRNFIRVVLKVGIHRDDVLAPRLSETDADGLAVPARDVEHASAETPRGVQGMMGQLLLAGLAVTIAWRAGYRFWLVKRYGGNRVDPDEVHLRMRAGEDLLVIDLRRDDDFDASDRMIAGAARLRPASFHRYAMHLPRDRDLVFYCT